MPVRHFRNSWALCIETAIAVGLALLALQQSDSRLFFLFFALTVFAFLAAALEWWGVTIDGDILSMPVRRRGSLPFPTFRWQDIPASAIERVDLIPPALFFARLQIEARGVSTVVYLGSRHARRKFLAALCELAPAANVTRRG